MTHALCITQIDKNRQNSCINPYILNKHET